jgi:hypothetical protein
LRASINAMAFSTSSTGETARRLTSAAISAADIHGMVACAILDPPRFPWTGMMAGGRVRVEKRMTIAAPGCIG